MLGITVKTLQRWDNEGKQTAYRSPNNRRFYTHNQYEELMGINKKQEGKHVIYARVSNRGLKHQGMMKNRHVSKAVASQGFYTFKLWLVNLCRKYGIELRQVDKFFPSFIKEMFFVWCSKTKAEFI